MGACLEIYGGAHRLGRAHHHLYRCQRTPGLGARARAASQILLDAIETIPQGFALFGADRRIFLCNTSFADLYRVPKETLVGLSVEEIGRRAGELMKSFGGVHVDADESWITTRLERFNAASRTPIEVEMKDGRWYINSDHPTSDGGVVFVRTDISEQKRAQERLRDSQAFNSAIVKSSLDAIVTIDESGRVLEFNPAAERIFGYSRDEALGRDVAELIVPPFLQADHQSGFGRYLTTGERQVLGRRIEIEAMRRDGSLFSAELAITEVLLHGKRVSPPICAIFPTASAWSRRCARASSASAASPRCTPFPS